MPGWIASLREKLGHAVIETTEMGKPTTVLDVVAEHLLGEHYSQASGRQIDWVYLQAAAKAFGIRDPNPLPKDRY